MSRDEHLLAIAPPSTIEADPDAIRTPRRLARAVGRGVVFAAVGAATIAALLIIVSATGLFDPFGPWTWRLLVTLGALAAFGWGAARSWLEPAPDAGVTVGADGVMLRREDHRAFYPWSTVGWVRVHGSVIVVGLDAGYAYRVPFRTRRRAQRALHRIQREREAYLSRLTRSRDEPSDVPQPGDEGPWLARQRARFRHGYRWGHADVEDALTELADVDAPIFQRLGAAIALAGLGEPQIVAALRRVRDLTANERFAEALDGLVQGHDQAEALTAWLRAMQPSADFRRVRPLAAEKLRVPSQLRADDPSPPGGAIEAERDAEAEREAQEMPPRTERS